MSIVAEEILPPEREEKTDKPGLLKDRGVVALSLNGRGNKWRWTQCNI